MSGSSSGRLSVRLPAQHEHGCAQRRRRPLLEPTGGGGSGACPAHVPSLSLSARISPSRIGKCCCAATIASYPGVTRHRRRWTEITDTRRGRVCREGVHAEAHLPAARAQLAVAAQQPPQVVAGAGTSLHPAAARRHPAGATVQRRSPHLDPERRHSPRGREEPRRLWRCPRTTTGAASWSSRTTPPNGRPRPRPSHCPSACSTTRLRHVWRHHPRHNLHRRAPAPWRRCLGTSCPSSKRRSVSAKPPASASAPAAHGHA